MNKDNKGVSYLLLVFIAVSIVIIVVTPLTILEYLSIEIVGEPPINGRTWMEGVEELGGELSFRMIGILGLLIFVLTLPFALRWESKPIPKRDPKNIEFIVFFITLTVFFIINFLIGYAWWDPKGFLGMGPLFFQSIISIVILGLLPGIYRYTFKFKKEGYANNTENLREISIIMIILAYGYGLISCIWHCCSFYAPSIYFFYFGIKLIQLWGLCTFFFKYGLPLFLSKFKPWVAYLIISLLFGLCYPWHTIGYVFTFALFGLGLCYLTRKTGSYFSGLILLYFAYIFHAGLPWHGPLITFTMVYPISLAVLSLLIYLNLIKQQRL